MTTVPGRGQAAGDPAAAEPPFGALAPTGMQAALLSIIRHSFLRRGDFRRYFTPLLNSLRPTAIDGEFRGAKFRLHYQDNLAETGMLCSPHYNDSELKFLMDATPAGGVFVDLGANVGLYAITLARKVGLSGKVIAVDPGEKALQRLRFNIAANALTNIIVFPFAVGDDDYRANLRIPQGDIALSQVVPSKGGSIQVRPLTAMLEEAGVTHIDTMKVDVEGFEEKVLPPFFNKAPRTLWPKRIVLEPSTFHGRVAIHGFVERLGYIEVDRNRKNSLYRWKNGD
jgi:FkbM family methyltransferase